MSKLSFRARALDPSKQMPIFLAEELPDLPEYSAINRAVPQMPSGMEKEEESEHHLQRAICTGLIIPTPEVYSTENIFYDQSYPANYKMPRQLIHMQPLGLEQDVPDYDMDSADEAWVNQQNRRLDLTPLKFEQMMDRLEKSSGQTVITLNEAKALLRQDDELSIAIYDYWLNKRLKMQHPLIPTVKTENRPGASSNNPYLAFRRRTEKMQTRKNRKNDETSYEKMLKLRRDLQRATTVLEMVKRREKTKREHLHLSIEIFEKRVQLRDFSGAVYSELNASLKNSRLAFAPLYTNQYSHHSSSAGSTPTGGVPGTAAGGTSGILPTGILTATGVNNSTLPGSSSHLYSTASQYLNSTSLGIDVINAGSGAANVGGIRKEKRQYKKRKHKLPRDKQQAQHHHQYLATTGGAGVTASSVAHHSHLHHHHHLHRQSSSPAANESNVETEEEDLGMLGNGNGHHAHKIGSESEEETPFAFRRKQNCDYLKASESTGNWPWEPKQDRENGFSDSKYRFTLTSIRHPRPRCIGFARRRLGRGGRVIFDRVATNFDDFWSQLDYTILESGGGDSGVKTMKSEEIELLKKQKLLRKRMPSPPTVVDLPSASVSATTTTTTTPAAIAATTKTTITTPATLIKTEISDNQQQQQQQEQNNAETDFDDYSDLELDDEAFTDLHRCADYTVSQDARYTSTVSLKRRRLERYLKRRNKRRRQNGIQNGHNSIVSSSTLIEEQPTLPDLPRHLLRQLAKSMGTSLNVTEDDIAVDNAPIKDDREEQTLIDTPLMTNQQIANNVGSVSNGSSRILNNNIISSNSLSLNEKFDVIKLETNTAPTLLTSLTSATLTPSSTTTTATVAAETLTTDIEIKQEILDTASCASADDSNEPLSSIQKSAVVTTVSDIALEDEENVNLAQLSNIIRHTVKKEEEHNDNAKVLKRQQNIEHLHDHIGYEQLSDEETPATLNQVADVIRVHLKNKKNRQMTTPARKLNIIIDESDKDEAADNDYPASLSPSSSQRIDFCNELLSEIRRDWLHFRPKTPTDELSDGDENSNAAYKLPPLFDDALVDGGCESLVNWSKQTPITVEMLRVEEQPRKQNDRPLTEIYEMSKSKLTNGDGGSSLFVTDSFKYEELDADTQLLQTIYAPHVNRESPEANLDFNISGDSLNDISLLEVGSDENDENIIDNILQECQIDDIKTLNQATNFWNGILDGDATAEVDMDDDELLGCKKDTSADKSRGKRNKAKQRAGCSVSGSPLGSCAFNVQTQRQIRDEFFFNKQIKPEEERMIKGEISETPAVTTAAAATTTTTTIPAAVVSAPLKMPPLVVIKKEEEHNISGIKKSEPITTTAAMATTQQFSAKPIRSVLNSTIKTQHSQQQLVHPVIGNLTQLMTANTTNNQLSSTAPQLNEIQTAAVGDIITLPAKNQQQTQHHILQIKQQSSNASPTTTTTQFRNITVQQLSQQQQQQRQQQQQQQLLLHMQRDLVSNAPIITQYVTSSGTQIRQQPTLTPIGATTSNAISADNHQLTYIATTDDGVVTATGGGNGPQKIYIQKAPATGAVGVSSATQVPNNVITLSNMKLENEGNVTVAGTSTVQQTVTPSTTRILFDNSSTGGVNAGNVTSPSLNIINTASGQQVAVHNIAAGNAATSGTPLIVTTQRGAQQLTQQQLLQPTQQIVWRQIGTTTGGTVLTTTTEAAAAMAAAGGNKIVWASRTGQKRQLNGPDGTTDISKLLLNRKYSQRKVIAAQQSSQQQLQQQHHHQQQIQIVKQQQIVQVDEDSNSAASSQSAGSSGAGSNSSTVNEITTAVTSTPVNATTQQLQKLQMQSGKVIKMSTFPLLVSELNMQQQQQQQQKHNSAAAIAANHNYSLQPGTAIITSQAAAAAGGQTIVSGGNKIYLTSSGAATVVPHGATNFTIATTTSGGNANELVQQATTTQKIHYKDLQNSQNLKVNVVQTSSGGGNAGQAGQTVVLNKSLNAVAAAAQQQKLKRERILNIIGTTSVSNADISGGGGGGGNNVVGTSVSGGAATNAVVSAAASPENNKRVVYTSLLNVKKTNTGQVQMQIGGPGGIQHIMRGRIGNNQTIFTNMRTLPIATMQQQQSQQQQQQQQQVQVIGSSTNLPLTMTTTYAAAQQQQTSSTSSSATISNTPTSVNVNINSNRNKTTTTATTAAVVVVSASNENSRNSTVMNNENRVATPTNADIAANDSGGGQSNSTNGKQNNNAPATINSRKLLLKGRSLRRKQL